MSVFHSQLNTNHEGINAKVVWLNIPTLSHLPIVCLVDLLSSNRRIHFLDRIDWSWHWWIALVIPCRQFKRNFQSNSPHIHSGTLSIGIDSWKKKIRLKYLTLAAISTQTWNCHYFIGQLSNQSVSQYGAHTVLNCIKSELFKFSQTRSFSCQRENLNAFCGQN